MPLSQCRICGNTCLRPVIDLGIQTLTGIFPTTRDQKLPSGRLELVKCDGGPDVCGLVQLKDSWDPDIMYGANYGYRSGLNPSMVRHLQDLAKDVRNAVDLLPGDLVLDIGSNDGTLLAALAGPGITLVGVDPTAAKFRQYYPPDAHVIPELFSAESFIREFGSRKAKSVTSVAMFYDLEQPEAFMREVAAILDEDGVWTFEQSYLPSMIAKDSYDTICHEHLEYYCLRQIQYMADRCDLKIIDVSLNESNGGSFRVKIGLANHRSTPREAVESTLRRELEGGFLEFEIYQRFRERIEARRHELKVFLETSRRAGRKIFGYGASTKGNVILQYANITAEDLPLIADVNPDKHGSFTPGTLIPIVPEHDARSQRPDAFVVFPWHFREFIVKKEEAFLSAGGRLIFPLPTLESVPPAPLSSWPEAKTRDGVAV